MIKEIKFSSECYSGFEYRKTMEKDAGSGGPSTPGGSTGRVRRRRGSNEVCNVCYLI